MASGSDGKGRHGRPGGGRRADLEAERDELQVKIDELRDEIYYLEEGITDTTRIDVDLDTFLARKRAALDKLEAKRDALQEKIDAL